MSNLSAELWRAIEAYSTADASRTHADLVVILRLMNQRMDGVNPPKGKGICIDHKLDLWKRDACSLGALMELPTARKSNCEICLTKPWPTSP